MVQNEFVRVLKAKIDEDGGDRYEPNFEVEMTEHSRSLSNARKQGQGLRFPKSAVKSNQMRFRPNNR
jgi:hypothetical protein